MGSSALTPPKAIKENRDSLINKPNKRYINEVMTWGVNEAKWRAAAVYCNDRGWKFDILTEKELGIKF